jgi:hypothetical protein
MIFSGAVPGILDATYRDEPQMPPNLPNAMRIDPWTEATSKRLLFAVPGIARYLVENGTTIGVEAAPDAARNAVELFLHGSARGFLIHQRGELALEAAALVTPTGRAVAISGSSGTGKSTLAAELCRRGWSLISDDITRVTWTRGRALAWPSHDAVKLWLDACERLQIDVRPLSRTRTGIEKFYVKMPAASAPTVLQTVVRLQFSSVFNSVEIPTAQATAVLSDCSFRRRHIPALGREADHEGLLRQVAGVCRVVVLAGARGVPTEAFADQIARVVS